MPCREDNQLAMADISDAEIHEIVQRVLQQTLGSSTREPVSTNPAPAQAAQVSGRKVVAIGADHGGFELKEALKPEINALGFDIQSRWPHNIYALGLC